MSRIAAPFFLVGVAVASAVFMDCHWTVRALLMVIGTLALISGCAGVDDAENELRRAKEASNV